MRFRKNVKVNASYRVSKVFVINFDGIEHQPRVVIPNYLIKRSACILLTDQLSIGRIGLLESNTEIRYIPEINLSGVCVRISYAGCSILKTKLKLESLGLVIAEDMCRIMRKYSKPKHVTRDNEFLKYL